MRILGLIASVSLALAMLACGGGDGSSGTALCQKVSNLCDGQLPPMDADALADCAVDVGESAELSACLAGANDCTSAMGCAILMLANSGCEEGMYECDAGAQCMTMNMVCDGQVDCDDGSDEADCPQEPAADATQAD